MKIETNVISTVFWGSLVFWLSAPFILQLQGLVPWATYSEATPYYRYFRYFLSGIALTIMFTRFNHLPMFLANCKMFLIYLILIATLIPLSSDTSWSLNQYIIFIFFVSSAMAINVNLNPPKVAKILFWVCFIFTIITPVYTLMFPSYAISKSNDVIGHGTIGAWRGLFGSKNDFGHCSALSASIILIFGDKYLNKKIFLIIAKIVAICLVIFSKSSTAILILGCSYLFYILIIKSLYNSKNTLYMGLILLLLSPIIMYFGVTILDSLFNFFGKDTTLSGRTGLWKFGLERAMLLFPQGGGYGYTSSPEMLYELNERFKLPHFHNAYLELLINNGLASVLFYISIILVVIKVLILKLPMKNDSAKQLFLLILFICFVSGITEPLASRNSGQIAFFGYCAFFGLTSLVYRNQFRIGQMLQ